MVKVVVDTSVLIEFARTGKGLYEDLLLGVGRGDVVLLTSSVVMYEFWSGKSMESEKVERVAEDLFSDLRVVGLDESVAKIAGKLQRRGKARGNDALIAAVALEGRAQLATLNKKDFEDVPELKLWRL